MTNALFQKSLVSMLSIMVCCTATAGTTVENFSGSGTIYLNYPGTVSLSGTTFSGKAILRSFEFASGTQRLGVDDIDLHGLEPAFDRLVVEGKVLVPNTLVNTGTTLRGTASLINVNTGLPVVTSSSVTFTGVPVKEVSPEFLSISTTSRPASGSTTDLRAAGGCAATQLEVLAGSGVGTRGYLSSVSDFQTASSVSIVNVDTANGLIDFSGLGSISEVAKPVAAPAASALVPTAGLGLLLFGLAGLALMRVVSRDRVFAAA